VADVSIDELRTRVDEVVDRAAGGEQITITRAGRAVAELRPATDNALTADALLARWRHLPPVDPDALKSDIDNF
jgi:prevent-host-death family protein